MKSVLVIIPFRKIKAQTATSARMNDILNSNYFTKQKVVKCKIFALNKIKKRNVFTKAVLIIRLIQKSKQYDKIHLTAFNDALFVISLFLPKSKLIVGPNIDGGQYLRGHLSWKMYIEHILREPLTFIKWHLTLKPLRERIKARYTKLLFSVLHFGEPAQNSFLIRGGSLKNSHIIRGGIDVQKEPFCNVKRKLKKEKMLTLIYGARLEYWKGFDLFEEIIINNIDRYNYIICGSGHLQNRAYNLQEKFDNVTYYSGIDRESYLKILFNGDIFFHPSWGEADASTAVVEALSLGLNVVCWRIPGLMYLEKTPNLLMFENFNYQEAISKIICCEMNIFNNDLNELEKYDINNSAKKLIKIYSS